jgi:cysteine desulfurase
MISNLIYFNNNRTTTIDPRVTTAMLPYRKEGSKLTQTQKDDAVSEALSKLSTLTGADPAELFLTSGTTESVYLAIKTIYELYKYRGNHIITNSTEHFAVLDCCEELRKQGAEVTFLGVDREGLVDADELKAEIRPTTVLVSIMAANNETGVIQPVEKISEICRENNVLFFSDASQFIGKMRCDVNELGFDCAAFGAHKMYGPEKIGALVVRKGTDLYAAIKKNYTSKLPVHSAVGFGKAAELFNLEYWDRSEHVSRLKNYFEHQLLDIEGLRINGSTRHRLYNTSNLTFPDTKNIISLLNKYDFAENQKKPSYVLSAMKLSKEEIRNSFRFSFGKYNSLEEVKEIVEDILKL